MAKHLITRGLVLLCLLIIPHILSAEVVNEMSTKYPPYVSKGWDGIKGKATGFFHVEKTDGKWWVIDPAGNAFFIIGTDHVNYNVHWCEKLGYAPYHKKCEEKYGSEEKWAETNVPRLASWNFNCLAANNSPSTRHKGLAHMEFLGMGMKFASKDYITEQTFWTGFPNVFSPEFETFCDEMAKNQCAPQKDDPWLIGYFIDNELEWYGKKGSLFIDAFEKPADHTAKIALVNLLKERYKGDIKAFNTAWKTEFASFDELLKLDQAPNAGTPKAESDVKAYVRLVVDRYFAATSAAIRKHDPNHMVLGTRFAGRSPDAWDIAGKYCDIVSVNCYRRVDLDKGILMDGFEKELEEWYKEAKRPFMITEWSFPAMDTPLPSQHGAGQRVPTQKDRARAFTIFQKLLFTTPFMVGSDYFMWVDEPALGISGSFPEDSNYGLVNEDDEPYKLLTEAAAKLNALVYDLHSGKMADIYVKPGKDGSFTVGNAGNVDAPCTISLWIDGKLTESKMSIPSGKSQEIAIPQDVLKLPGGHMLICRADQQNPLLEINETNNQATQTVYTPVEEASGTPVIIENPTARDIENHVFTLGFGAQAYQLKDGEITAIPSQVIGDKLLVTLDKLEARRCATLFVSKDANAGSSISIAYREKEIDNGVLKIIKGSDRSAFNKVFFGSVEVGGFFPLIMQKDGQNFWVRPSRIDNVKAHQGPVALVLDMTFVYEDDNPSAQNCAHNYRTAYRFTIYPNKLYYSAQFLWVENTDNEPWQLETYYHCAPSNIDGDSSDDNPKARYWLDPKAKLCYGVEVPDEFEVILWKDDNGIEHPDVFRKPYFSKILKPGERLIVDDPAVYVIAGDEQGFMRTADELHALSDIEIKVY